jgi:formamidopyrimidine-DNA glycosylase
MPELPEVETYCRLLRDGGPENPSLLGKVIQKGEVLWPRTLQRPSLEEFQARLPGQAIEAIRRRAKYLVFELTHDSLILHLRMSGDLLVEPHDLPPAAHHRLLLFFEGGQRLAFNDARKFGCAWLVGDPQEVLGGLGPEPLDPRFSAADLHARLQAVRRQLKPLLLDQAFLAGLGNIYTDEALHLARLHPLTPSDRLDAQQAAVLLEAIRAVLQEGIRRNGASIDWVYRGGAFQNYFRVYQRTGQPCPVCGALIERLLVGQRGTHVCPVCQARP